jgi:hypothetical protein
MISIQKVENDEIIKGNANSQLTTNEVTKNNIIPSNSKIKYYYEYMQIKINFP